MCQLWTSTGQLLYTKHPESADLAEKSQWNHQMQHVILIKDCVPSLVVKDADKNEMLVEIILKQA